MNLLHLSLSAVLLSSAALASNQITPYPGTHEVLRPSFADSDFLRFFFYSRAVKTDWSSPSRAAWTGLETSQAIERDYSTPPVYYDDPPFGPQAHYKDISAPHSIGHTNVNLHCVGEPEHWSGQTDQNDDEVKSWIWGGAGMELMFHDIVGQGYFFTREDILNQLPQFYNTGRMVSITIKINHASCERLLQYAGEYSQKGYEKIFGGLLSRPRYGEGAGCTAYGLSYMELAGLMTPELQKRLSVELNIPNELLGHYPASKPESYNLIGLAFHGLLDDDATRWASEGEPHFHVSFYDPDLAFDWVQGLYASSTDAEGNVVANGSHVIDAYSILNTQHVVIDETQVPTPTDPIWLDPATNPKPSW